MSIGVLIVTWNNDDTIGACLASIARQAVAESVRAYIWDNGSTDSTRAIARAAPGVVLLKSEVNVGFARGVNRLAEIADEDVLLLLNPDTQLRPGALRVLLDAVRLTAGAAIVGGRLIRKTGEEQLAAARPFPRSLDLAKWLLLRQPTSWELPTMTASVDAVSGAFMLVPRRIWDAVGGLDEGYPHAGEDLELCLAAARSGVTVVYEPAASAFHVGEASVEKAPPEIDVLRWIGAVRFARSYEGEGAARLLRTAIGIHASLVAVAALFGRARSARSAKRARLLLKWAVGGSAPALPSTTTVR